MSQIIEEELNQPVTEETTTPEIQPQEEIVKNYETIVQQQQEQIQQLLKQQEINKKMVQQLSEVNKQFQKTEQEKAEDNMHGVDKVLQKFKYDYPNYDPENVFFGKQNTRHLATGYIQYLKNQGCSNAEISHRMNNIFKHIEGAKQIHEEIS